MISLKDNKLFFAAGILLDFLFVLFLVQAQFLILLPATERVVDASSIVSQEMSSDIFGVETALRNNSEFMSAFHDILYLTFIFFLAILVLWIVFKGPAWFFAHKSFLKKIPFWNFWGKFALLSLFWFFILLLFLFISAFINKYVDLGPVVFIIFAIIIFYFSQVSFSLIPSAKTFKKTFIIGVSKIKRLIVSFAINVGLLIVAFYIPLLVAKKIPWLGFVLFLLLMLPSLLFGRINMIFASWSKDS